MKEPKPNKVEKTIGFGVDKATWEYFAGMVAELEIGKSELARRAYLRGLRPAITEIEKEKEEQASRFLKAARDQWMGK